jgi:hypothetical protein
VGGTPCSYQGHSISLTRDTTCPECRRLRFPSAALLVCSQTHLYTPPFHVGISARRRGGIIRRCRPRRAKAMHDPASGVRRIDLLRTPVNKRKEEGRGCSTPRPLSVHYLVKVLSLAGADRVLSIVKDLVGALAALDYVHSAVVGVDGVVAAPAEQVVRVSTGINCVDGIVAPASVDGVLPSLSAKLSLSPSSSYSLPFLSLGRVLVTRPCPH